MEREEIKQVVIELIHDKGYFGDIPTEETTLDDIGWDSMDFAEIQVHIEQHFFITPKDAEWTRAKCVGDWITLVEKYVN